jgi:hypothetical protein
MWMLELEACMAKSRDEVDGVCVSANQSARFEHPLNLW